MSAPESRVQGILARLYVLHYTLGSKVCCTLFSNLSLPCLSTVCILNSYTLLIIIAIGKVFIVVLVTCIIVLWDGLRAFDVVGLEIKRGVCAESLCSEFML